MLSRDHIDIERLNRRCIIGVLAHEREEPQTLTADLRIWLDATEAAITGNLDRSIDYGALATEAAFVLDESRFRLLESAALCLVRLALAPRGKPGQPPDAARVTLRKPHVLAQPAVAAVTIERRADELAFPSPRPGVTEVFSCPETRVFLHAQVARPAGSAALETRPGLWLAVERLG